MLHLKVLLAQQVVPRQSAKSGKDKTTDKGGLCNFCSVLVIYQTILAFYDPEEEDLKTLLGKEKMLVTSIFSISNNVFNPIKHRKSLLNYN